MNAGQVKLHHQERRRMERILPVTNIEALRAWCQQFTASTDRYDHARAAMVEREIDRRRRIGAA